MNKYILYISLFTISIISLILSIIAITKKNDSFSNILNIDECLNNTNLNEEEKNDCIKNIKILNSNINSQYWSLANNRGIKYPGNAIAGSFGNPNIL